MKSSDKELLERVIKKDYNAFNVLYERYNRLFMQWVYLRTKDKEIAKEICQIFWENIWSSAVSFRLSSDGSAKNSLLKILSFRITDYLRSPTGRKESIGKDFWQKAEKNLSYNHVLESLEVNELQKIITDTLYEMPLLMQQVFELRWKKRLTVKKTAVKLRISEKTVNKKYKEAKRLLKEKLILIYQDEETPLLTKTKVLSLIILLQANSFLSTDLKAPITTKSYTEKINKSTQNTQK